MRILVTGGAGFIGSHITDVLLADGDEVLIVDDLSTGKRKNLRSRAGFEQIDIRDRTALMAVFHKFQPEAVCHQAAQTSVAISTRDPIRDAEINILGLIHVLDACVACKTGRIVFASSGGTIYGDVPEGHKASVGDPLQPLSPYGTSKLAGEHYLHTYHHEHGLAFTALRYANVYGPRQDPHGEAGVVAIFSRRLVKNESIRVNAMRSTGDAGCVRDYVFVRDVVRANVAALRGEIDCNTLDVCTGVPSTTLAIAKGIETALGIDGQISFGPRRAGDLERSVLDEQQFVKKLGPTVALDEGLAQTATWFRDHDET